MIYGINTILPNYSILIQYFGGTITPVPPSGQSKNPHHDMTKKKTKTPNPNLSIPPTSAPDVTASKASTYESTHVHEVYDAIAPHFSLTRSKPWPRVEEFLNSLAANSLIVDVGCGNGKYMTNTGEKQHTFIGMDRCNGLTKCASIRTENDVIDGDCLQIPLQDGMFDAALNIAVVHHICTRERRIRAWQETVRLLRIDGLALCFVWARERPEGVPDVRYQRKMLQRTFEGSDMLVPWHYRTKKEGADSDHILGDPIAVYKRYYHIYNQGELEEELRNVPGIHIIKSYFAHQNWCAIIQRFK